MLIARWGYSLLLDTSLVVLFKSVRIFSLLKSENKLCEEKEMQTTPKSELNRALPFLLAITLLLFRLHLLLLHLL